MKNKRPSDNNGRKEEGDDEKKEKKGNNELELYKESAKSTEVMTKSWLRFFGIKSLSKNNKEQEEKK
jgi:hypothetical protein